MEITTPGSKYTLPNAADSKVTQELQFVSYRVEQSVIMTKAGSAAAPAKIVVDADGVSATEVLQAVLDRLGFSYSRFNTIQILLAAHHVELALAQLRDLEAGLKAQGVESAPLP